MLTLAAPASAALALFAGSTSLAAGARAEAATGVTPRAPGEEPEPGVVLELAPLLALREWDARQAFILRYRPRLSFRYPNFLGMTRPLLLHAGELSYNHALSRRLVWAVDTSAYYGEVGYQEVPRIVGSGPASGADRAVVQFAGVTPSTRFDYAVTRRYTVGVGFLGSYATAVGDYEDLPTTVEGYGLVEQRWTLGRRDSLTVPLTVGEADADPGFRYQVASGALGWGHAITRSSSSTLMVGATGVRELGTEDTSYDLFPMAEAGAEGQLSSWPGARLRGSLATGLQSTMDATTGVLRPIATANAGLVLATPPWSTHLDLGANAPVTREPVEPPVSETFLFGSLWTERRARSGLSYEFGVRTAQRAAHPRVDPWTVTDYDVLGFFAISYVVSLGPGGSDWAR